MKARGITPDDNDYMRIRDNTSGMITPTITALDKAIAAWENALPASWTLVNALRALKDASGGVEDAGTSGIWHYQIVDPVSTQAATCTEAKGWYELKFDKAVNSQSVRASNWNANGSWGGSFLQVGIGGGSSSFSNTVRTDGENILVRFCNIQYVAVQAPWLYMDVLRDVDRGLYAQKPDSMIKGQKILGPEGLIPRMVKGLIIARDVDISAKLSKTSIDELKKSASGKAGFGLGPWKVGGSAGKTKYDAKNSKEDGLFSLSTNYGRPVILAVVLEDTISPPTP